MSEKNSQTNTSQIDTQKVDQAIPHNYDSLNAKDARKAIGNSELYGLLNVTMHEFYGKRRPTVMRTALTKLFEYPQTLTFKKECQSEAEKGFTILLVGETGTGKSSTINTLFGKEVATTSQFKPGTKSVTPFEGTYRSVKYTVYDTPGLGEWTNNEEDLDEKYLSLMKDKCPSPDVLWYVIKLDDNRVKRTDAAGMQLIFEYFGDDIWDRTMIVFTHSDKFKSSAEFQESFDGRTETMNEMIDKITDGKVQGLPAAAVANQKDYTDYKIFGKSCLGKLFITSYKCLNPERRFAFLLAFAMDLEIPKRQPPAPKAKNSKTAPKAKNSKTAPKAKNSKTAPKAKSSKTAPKAKNSKKTTRKSGRIPLTEEQVNIIKETPIPVSDVLKGAIGGAGVGLSIDAATGGLLFGVPTLLGAIIGGAAAYVFN